MNRIIWEYLLGVFGNATDVKTTTNGKVYVNGTEYKKENLYFEVIVTS